MNSLYTLKRPVYKIEVFYGIDSLNAICALARTEEYSITCDKNGRLILTIAGLTLENQQLLCREPDGRLVVMTKQKLNQDFEVLK